MEYKNKNGKTYTNKSGRPMTRDEAMSDALRRQTEGMRNAANEKERMEIYREGVDEKQHISKQYLDSLKRSSDKAPKTVSESASKIDVLAGTKNIFFTIYKLLIVFFSFFFKSLGKLLRLVLISLGKICSFIFTPSVLKVILIVLLCVALIFGLIWVCKNVLPSVFNGVGGFFASAWDGICNFFASIWNFISSIPFRISSWFSDDSNNSGNENNDKDEYIIDYELSYDETYYIVTGYTGSAKHIIIPSLYENLPVCEIKSRAFYENGSLRSVELPSTIKNIKSDAFYNCYRLSEINIPYGIREIGAGAFFKCSSLKSIVLPASLRYIGHDAFHYCTNLDIYVELDDYVCNKSYIYYGNINFASKSVTWRYNNITSDPYFDYVVHGDEAVLTYYKGNSKNVVIPSEIDGYKVVDFGCIFVQNKVIETVVIPDTINEIAQRAFSECSNLKSVDIPNSVIEIGEHAFSASYNLTTITLPQSLTRIEESVFSGCRKLTSINIPNSVTSIGRCAFDSCYNLTEVIIPDGVSIVGWAAFSNCIKLQTVKISSCVREMESMVFNHCDNLTIYCKNTSKPQGWDENWCGYGPDVLWGN